MSRTPFDEAWHHLPTCLVGSTVDDAQSFDELVGSVQTELDLISEGEAVYTSYEVRQVRKYFTWLTRFMA